MNLFNNFVIKIFKYNDLYDYLILLYVTKYVTNKNLVVVINMKIKLGNVCDIDSWMDLVDKVKQNFSGLETKEALDEHKNTVLSFMNKESAICAKIDDKIVGTLLFSKDNNMLCFLAVDPEYRRQHIAEKMVSYMRTFMDYQIDIVVTTYREGVPEGIAAREFYKRLGFIEGKLAEEFGSPVQEFILKR